MADRPKDWRDIGGGTPSPAAQGGRAWQQRTAITSTPRQSRRAKRIVALSLLALLMMFMGIVVKWLSPLKPACLVLIGSGYEENLILPQNSLGWNGLLNLEKHVAEQDTFLSVRFPWDQPNKIRRIAPPIELKAEQTWKDVWKEIPAFKEKTIILFFSLHGLADSNDVYLLANDAHAQTRISFGDILDGFKKYEDKNVVVFLDIGQLDSCWPLGILHNEFVKRLRAKYDDKIQALQNVLVICSTSADQRPWSAHAFQNSVFAHFVAEGLKGAAARSSNERITARRLFDYVEAKVDQWAQLNRARNQKPIMLGRKGLAESIELVHVQSPYQEQNAPQAASFEPRALEADWKKWKELRSSSPFVHSPHLWRQYEETLLRYEDLMRGGDVTGKAQTVKDRLKSIEGKIDQARVLDAANGCLSACFPVRRVLGHRQSVGDAVGLFEDLRRGTEDERAKLLSPFGPRDRRYLQVRLGQLFLDHLSQEKKIDGKRERDWLKRIESDLAVDRDAPSPAEVHLFKMLKAADPRLSDAAVQQALRVRRLAEEAAFGVKRDSSQYLYSEVTFAWTGEAVSQADVVRRDGEDQLFGEPKTYEAAALARLSEAEAAYLGAIDSAARFQLALNVRDEVCAELPQLARWLALAPAGGVVLAKTKDLRDAMPALGKNLAELSEVLDSKRRPDPGELSALAGNIAKVHKAIRDRYSDFCRNFPAVAVQLNWHEIEHALSIPPPAGGEAADVAMRLDLLRKHQKITAELHNGVPMGPVQDPRWAERIERQRLILSAMLKPFTPEPLAGLPGAAGDGMLQDFFIGLPDIIAKNSQHPADELEPLRKAANLCRIVPAALVDEANPFSAVDRLRRLRTSDLLLWQAERTWQDHWFDPDKQNGPVEEATYYLPVARSYLDGARELVKADFSKETLIKKIDQIAAGRLKLASLASPPSRGEFWTTELTFPLTWTVTKEGELPPGKPMGWLQAENRKELLWQKEQQAYVLPVQLYDKSIWPAGTNVGKRTMTFQAVYRGQTLAWNVDLVRPSPDVIVRQLPPPKTSGLAVLVSDFNYGAVSIVLDNSGSMTREPTSEKEAKKPDRRWDFAVLALEKVFNELPENTKISLCTFGPVEKKVDINETGVKRIQSPTALTMEERKKLINRLKNAKDNEINFNSPVAAAIIDSMENGFDPDHPGPKVILVLTDGEDNYSYLRSQKMEGNQLVYVATAASTRKLKENLREAHLKPKNRDISVVVIGLIDDSKEEAKKRAQTTRDQFEGVEEFTPKSAFMLAKDPKALGETILDILQPRLELFENGKALSKFKLGHTGNRFDSGAVRWEEDILPRTYEVRFTRGSAFDVRLDPPQNLIAILTRKNRKFYLERGVLGQMLESEKNDLGQKKGEGRDKWLVSLLDRKFDFNEFEQLIAFESLDTATSENVAIKQRYPGFVWLELDAIGDKLRDTLYWQNEPDVAAPAYRVNVSAWPSKMAQPQLKTWFWPRDRKEFAGTTSIVTRVRLDIDKPRAEAQELPAIESAQWEEREGGKKLVVRVRHAVNRPVMVDFDFGEAPAKPVTAEHRYYRAAGRYTAIFSGVPEDWKHGLIMVDLEAFKKEAQRVVFPRSNEDTIPQRITAPKSLLGPGR